LANAYSSNYAYFYVIKTKYKTMHKYLIALLVLLALNTNAQETKKTELCDIRFGIGHKRYLANIPAVFVNSSEHAPKTKFYDLSPISFFSFNFRVKKNLLIGLYSFHFKARSEKSQRTGYGFNFADMNSTYTRTALGGSIYYSTKDKVQWFIGIGGGIIYSNIIDAKTSYTGPIAPSFELTQAFLMPISLKATTGVRTNVYKGIIAYAEMGFQRTFLQAGLGYKFQTKR
jgi:hypothetical protein